MLDSLAGGAGFATWREFATADGYDGELISHAIAPDRTTHTSARDSTRLLAAIWGDGETPSQGCEEVRLLMCRQLARNRIAAAFERSVRISAKSGSLIGIIRNEIGVIELPGGPRYAVAVFTRAWRPYEYEARINAAIGSAARRAVDLLERRWRQSG